MVRRVRQACAAFRPQAVRQLLVVTQLPQEKVLPVQAAKLMCAVYRLPVRIEPALWLEYPVRVFPEPQDLRVGTRFAA